MKILSRILIFLLLAYKKFISPVLGNRCRFYPSCSEYAVESLRIFPLGKAILKIVYRLIRCGPWAKSGFDPVISLKNIKNKRS